MARAPARMGPSRITLVISQTLANRNASSYAANIFFGHLPVCHVIDQRLQDL